MFRIESVTLIYYLVMFNIKLSLSLLSATDIPKPFALVVCSINIYSTDIHVYNKFLYHSLMAEIIKPSYPEVRAMTDIHSISNT